MAVTCEPGDATPPETWNHVPQPPRTFHHVLTIFDAGMPFRYISTRSGCGAGRLVWVMGPVAGSSGERSVSARRSAAGGR